MESKEVKLSNREIELIHCLAQGMTNKESASVLFISQETVKSHRKNINRKLQVKNGVQLAFKAIRTGMIRFS